ncbi:Thrombospondin type-1 (TSP1) repeat,Spondin, N-terminal [Cinara cedri]|uniref:Thrombospondin type-1 (TSP1) repeat,Spondin, N-terminal n=1 Tax=Cinara cedri TaxID=506608 RepID=A0A5E4NA86_9HEMI|nr:Thrombospondin type-1 (TSP1) repeat,Spondin, N-terminal [Cinara cedri]
MKYGSRSHSRGYTMFREGAPASEGVRMFAKTGRSDKLDDGGGGEETVLDTFVAPSVATGAARTQAQFFVDGNHSRVSLVSRMIPSPDWFIGIDSFDLCVNGNWLDSITIEADPMDAGCDNGFTFTAPNWPTDPQGIIYRIKSNYPSHPASSFYYPQFNRLPTIATFQFIKIKEYEQSLGGRGQASDATVKIEESVIKVLNGDSDNDREVQLEMEQQRREQEYNNYKSVGDDRGVSVANVTSPVMIPKGDKEAIMNSIMDSYHIRKHKKAHKKSRYRDCRVGDWSEWSACSVSCGVGEMQRRREVVRHPRGAGRQCPPLLQTKWCGSAKDCPPQAHFKW